MSCVRPHGGGLNGLRLWAMEREMGETVTDALDEVMEYAKKQRREYAWIAEQSNKRGLEAKKLAAECRELAYFDVMQAIERIRRGQAA